MSGVGAKRLPSLASRSAKLTTPRKSTAPTKKPATGKPAKSRSVVASGHLVLVVGPSGAGKDTLLAAARRKFKGSPSLVFPRRTITRPEAIGEDHLPVSAREFRKLEQAGAFYLSWSAHGLKYGIPREAEHELRQGRSVVVNVSRQIVPEACARWPRTRIVHVTIALDALRARLEARGRETSHDIDRRLDRNRRMPALPLDLTDEIENSGRLSSAVRKFNALLARYADDKAKR